MVGKRRMAALDLRFYDPRTGTSVRCLVYCRWDMLQPDAAGNRNALNGEEFFGIVFKQQHRYRNFSMSSARWRMPFASGSGQGSPDGALPFVSYAALPCSCVYGFACLCVCAIISIWE
jgi:hypothetical protein